MPEDALKEKEQAAGGGNDAETSASNGGDKSVVRSGKPASRTGGAPHSRRAIEPVDAVAVNIDSGSSSCGSSSNAGRHNGAVNGTGANGVADGHANEQQLNDGSSNGKDVAAAGGSCCTLLACFSLESWCPPVPKIDIAAACCDTGGDSSVNAALIGPVVQILKHSAMTAAATRTRRGA